jgi:phosphoglycolate phosphatase
MTDLRILLWDIDGTLIRSTRPGAFKDYTIPALEKIFGTAGRLAEMSVSGMTDLQIACEALSGEGFTREQVCGRVDELRALYRDALEGAAAGGQGEPLFEVLPGARELLSAAREHPRFRSALLTGNVEPAARIKMRLVGLEEFFQLPGAFGDDSHDRRDLPAVAAARINRHLGIGLAPEQFVVIGDTPNDIDCARHFGARAVGVGTGRQNSIATLAPHSPDLLLPDLSDTAAVLAALEKL